MNYKYLVLSISIIVISISSSVSYAQNNQRINLTNGSDNTSRVVYNREYRIVERQFDYSAIDGSPYLDDELVLGYGILKNGDSLSFYMRYDMYSDEIEYLKADKLYTITNKPDLYYIVLNNYRFVYKDYISDGIITKGFLIQLYDDNYSLFEKKYTKFQDAKPQKTMPFSEATPAKFKTPRSEWYFSTNSVPISQFTPDNSGLKLISQNDAILKKLKSFIKQNHLKIRKEEDMISLFKYYNSILEQNL